MPRVISIHQPNYFPWMGYFYKMKHSDVFVFYDNTQIEHRSQQAFVNRTKIKTSQGELWLTCPIHVKPGKLIMDVELVQNIKWKKKHLKTLYYNYNRCRYFNQVFPEIEALINTDMDKLSDFNIHIIKWVANFLEITTEFVLSSSIPVCDCNQTMRLIKIAQYFDANVYLSGNGARIYQDENLFEINNIELCYTVFKINEYSQQYGNFIPKLSVLDAIFNMGKGATQIIK